MKFIKQNLKSTLIRRQHRAYEKKVREKDLSYDQWIRQQEEKNAIISNISTLNVKILTNDSLKVAYESKKMENEGNYSEKEEVLILTLYEGELSHFAPALIGKMFAQNENVILIYGDEDVQAGEERTDPWFKPDWSPDRFLSSFYFGGMIAVRRKELEEVWERCGDSLSGGKQEQNEGEIPDYRQCLYRLLYELIRQHGGFLPGQKRGQEGLILHIPEVLFHSRKPGYEQIRELALPEEIQREKPDSREALISVIIPSKDNPEVLFCCIRSLLERTNTVYPYEIVLVDNGSSEENRQRIEEELERLRSHYGEKVPYVYLYQPMEFNFSDMCNLGAEKAKGSFLLFLNDDMEILQPNWLDLMVEKAALPYAGAVGAKLLYPGSRIIQHVGITNLRVGPAHKLQFLDDGKVHYYGMNRGVHNMLAVTGACLLVRREVFRQAGGFCCELAVAFNDVDLCYTLYEMGYYNIVRNDVVLYHHESLSRGKDGESEEKQLRLLREKDLLYVRHQKLYGEDPFYNPYLTTDMLEAEYSPACRYQVTLDMPWSKVTNPCRLLKAAREDSCLVIGMECAMDIYKWKYGVEAPKDGQVETLEMGYYFQGYSFVIGSDNARYTKNLLLKSKKNGVIFAISVDERCRKDIKNNLGDQLNVDLTGFAAKLKKDAIPEGNYQFGILAKDRCSRQKLVNWSSWTLEVKK